MYITDLMQFVHFACSPFIELALRPDLTFVDNIKLNWFQLCAFAFHFSAHNTRSSIYR